MAEIWEVDLRSRKTGETIETIYSGDHDEAFRVMCEWYENHPEFEEIIPEKYVDGKDGVFADCYLVDYPHGVGKWETDEKKGELNMKYDCEIVKGTDNETILEAYDDKIQVFFSWIGEGWNGDYNENDEEDDKLIRFDVYYRDPENGDIDWKEVEDASYCTQLLVDSPIEYLEKKIKEVFNRYREVTSYIISGGSVKKMGEELSWIS